MSALTFAQALAKYRVAVAPTFKGRGVVTWFAGQRSADRNGTSIVLPDRRVDDKEGPEEALRELLLKIGAEDTLSGGDEPETPEAPEDEPAEPSAVEVSPLGAIVEEDGKFVLRLPDGREYKASRRRDLVRRVAKLTA